MGIFGDFTCFLTGQILISVRSCNDYSVICFQLHKVECDLKRISHLKKVQSDAY